MDHRLRQVAAHLCSAEQFTPAPIPSGGLFVDDYSKLPQPTTDLAQAKRDIDEFGYCECTREVVCCSGSMD